MSLVVPPLNVIPASFKDGTSIWCRLFKDIFFVGVTKLKVKPKAGIEPAAAIRQIRELALCPDLPLRHKEAGIPFLMSQLFEAAIWEI